MDNTGLQSRKIVFDQLLKGFLMFIVFAIVIPLVFGALSGIAGTQVLTMITSTFMFQAGAPPVGLALGLSPIAILFIMSCFAIGIVIAIFQICDGLASSSAYVKKWIDKLTIIIDKYPLIKKYGAFACLFIVWIPGVGLYGTPIIAWMMRWKRLPSIICTVTGFAIAVIIVLFFSSKIKDLLSL